MSPAGANVVALLAEMAQAFPHRPALVMGGPRGGERRATFGELWRRVDRAAAGFRRAGLAPGDRALVMVPMSIDLYVALLGLLAMGAVAVFVDPWVGLKQIAASAASAEPRAFVGSPRSHLLRLAAAPLRRLPLAVTTGRRLGRWPAAVTLAELEAGPGRGAVHPAAAADSALITFTSGSSGEPKGADRTHGFLLAQHRALAAEFPAAPGDVDMPAFPVFALNNLASGVPSVVPAMDFRRVDRVDPKRILAQMNAHGVTTATASPPFFDRLAEALAAGSPPPPRLRRILTGGAPVHDDQLARWCRLLPGVEVLVAYGSTEAEPVAHLEAGERLGAESPRGAAAPGYCAGRPIPRLEARLVRIHRGPIALGAEGWSPWEVARGEVGELLVTGDHVAKGYFRNPRAVAENKVIDPAGTVWHRMGDTGYFDAEGRFWLAGRVHSTIHRDGAAVHPQLVEQAARDADPRVRRVAAVGLADPELGERVAVVVESAAGPALTDEVAARVAAAGLPADEVLVTRRHLPLDPRHASKIDYGRLRERLERGGRRRLGER